MKPQSFGTIQICPQLSNFVRTNYFNDMFKKKLMHVHKRKMQRKMLINYNKCDGSCKLCCNRIQNASNIWSLCPFLLLRIYMILLFLSFISITFLFRTKNLIKYNEKLLVVFMLPFYFKLNTAFLY